MVVSVVGSLFISFAALTSNDPLEKEDFYTQAVPLQGQICHNGTDPHSHDIHVRQTPNKLGIVMIFLGLFLAGFGNTIFRSLSISYLDDNVTRQFSPVVLSLSMIVRFCAPILGLTLAATCLKVYIYPRYLH